MLDSTGKTALNLLDSLTFSKNQYLSYLTLDCLIYLFPAHTAASAINTARQSVLLKFYISSSSSKLPVCLKFPLYDERKFFYSNLAGAPLIRIYIFVHDLKKENKSLHL